MEKIDSKPIYDGVPGKPKIENRNNIDPLDVFPVKVNEHPEAQNQYMTGHNSQYQFNTSTGESGKQKQHGQGFIQPPSNNIQN